ncbi:hypothetical protein JTB14_005905 [Gonioctena quinquepunctata]|nr:hypothetical protein JTB14_005905 [Gonioctena quinquepunctata]
MATNIDNTTVFNSLITKIGNILHGRTEGDRCVLSKTLDDLNSLNYKFPVVTNSTKAVLLINQCCSFIPTDDEILVQKYSQLLWNLISRQNVPVEGRTLTVAVHWCLGGLKSKNKNVILDILQALEALLRNNGDGIISLVEIVTKEIGNFITNKEEECSPEIVLLSLQCLEACTVVITSNKSLDRNAHLEKCAEIFMAHLKKKPKGNENLVEIKMLQICLFGLQNIIVQHPDYLKRELGFLLGFSKTFMLYGIRGVEFLPARKLLPSTLSIPEPMNVVKEKKGGKLTKQRKHRSSGVHKKEKRDTEEFVFNNVGYTPANPLFENSLDSSTTAAIGDRLKTSDSDFSDNEAGNFAKTHQMQGRVRQAALNLLYNLVKNTEKTTFLSFWSSFIPEDSASGQHNLIVCILKDPSSKSRMAALNVLLLLLTTSKLFLSQAESSDKSTSFTPFSVVLGLTVKEIHRGLSLALSEMSVPVLIQVLKCFAALVQATPYHRMSPGLVTKVVRNVKHFVYNKDASVQVTALIVLGCVLASEPVLQETMEAMLKLQSFHEKNCPTNDGPHKKTDNKRNADDIDFAEFSDSDIEEDTQSVLPWLLAKCLNNLGVTLDEKEEPPGRNGDQSNFVVPAPVKLESLQVISAMSRNFFDVLIAPNVCHITKALDTSLRDKYTDLRLHAGRAVDFIGQAISKYLSNKSTKDIVPFEYCLLFWQTLLNGSLIDLLQSEQHPILRAVGCDCLGSIGSDISEKLPRDKQILCITLLFSCTRDGENSVRGAAIRALGMCILYTSLREDPGFVVDTAEAIYSMLGDENLMVRVKASWSLGNLSDALVLNSKSPGGIEEIPEDLILRLLQISINGASDNDKVKMNAVRAIGNLMQLFTDVMMKRTEFVEITKRAFDALVRNSTTGMNMKVRWNACYAVGNALKNSSLYQNYSDHTIDNSKGWQESVFKVLTELVVSFRNFKVRINAALALSSPSQREHYGKFYMPVWCALLKALENSQNMDDFSEYKHRDHLVEQVCISLGHLTTLLQTDDLMQLQETIQLYFDIFKTHTHKVLERLVPEKSTTLFSASYALTHFSTQNDLTSEQRSVMKCLTNIFVPEF